MKTILLLLLLFSNLLHAHTSENKYKIRPIHNFEQLPSKQIKQIMQDSEGYIWIATNNGLCQYNGYTFKIYKSSIQNPHLLYSNNINTIIEDTEQRIWIGTSQGLNILDKKTGKIESISNDNIHNFDISALLLASDSSIWIGTHLGVLHYKKDKSGFDYYKNLPNDTESISGNQIRSLKEDKNGNIWVSTFNDGFCYFEPKSRKFIRYPILTSSGRYNCLFFDDEQNLWIGAWADGIIKLEKPLESHTPSHKHYQLKKDYECLSHSIIQLPNEKNMIIGTNQGLYSINPENDNFSHLSSFEPILNDEINNLYVDRDQHIWIATQNSGAFIASKETSPFTNYPIEKTKGLNQPVKINTIFKWKEDKLLLGADKVSLVLYDLKKKEAYQYQDHPDFKILRTEYLGNIQTIFKHPTKNELWIGTEYAGLIICHLKEGKITSCEYKIQFGNIPLGESIYTINTDKKGNIWLGTNLGFNIITTQGDTLSYVNYYQTQAFCQDHTGAIWLGSFYNGLYRFKSDGDIYKPILENFNCKNNLINTDEIECIYEDRNNNLWVGTKGCGLSLYDREKNCFDPAPNMENVPGDIIYSITESEDDLILNTNQGIVIYNFKYRPRVLTTSDDILDKAGVRNAVSKAENGGLYYGTHKGFYKLQPDKIKLDLTDIQTIITDIKLFHTSFDKLSPKKQKKLAGNYHPLFSQNITLTSQDYNIGIEFAALSYIHPEKHRYAYKLEGFDKDWVYVDASQRTAYYTNLPAGTYAFYVKGINDSGIESSQETVFHIKVLPPIYKTGYAYSLYTLLIIGIIYLLYRLQLYRFHLQETVKIEQIERIKSEELNQSKLRFFTNISHEFLTPLSIISCSFEDIRRNFQISEQTQKAIESNVLRLNRLIEEILEFRKAENNKLILKITYGDIASFISGICQENFALLVKNKNIRLNLHCTPEHIGAWFDTDKIDKIMYNLLSNAIKFSFTDGRGQIDISLTANDPANEFEFNNLEIKVKNTGIGISEDRLPYIFTRIYEAGYLQSEKRDNGIGLSLTKSLVELHNGSISVCSQSGEWTEFTIFIPIHKKAFSDKQIEDTQNENMIFAASENQTEQNLGKKNTENKKLLLIEDDTELRNSLKNLLTEKYKIITASNGLEGLDIASKVNIDLIISDVMMPKIDGFELCKRIKKDTNTSHIPIILLTAKINCDDQLEGLKCGADAYITKPFNFNILEANIETILSNRIRIVEKFHSSPLTQEINLSVSSYEEKFLENAINTVKKNMENPEFDVKQFIEQMQVSNSMLYRKLKALTNLSPNEFIRNVRLKAAAELLQQKKGNIADIAYMVGFKDARYFSVCFKKEFNMTPGEYSEKKDQPKGDVP